MAYESQIGTYHLGENPQLYSPQRANNYEFIVTDIDGILRPGAVAGDTNASFRNAQEILRHADLRERLVCYSEQCSNAREISRLIDQTFSLLLINELLGKQAFESVGD